MPFARFGQLGAIGPPASCSPRTHAVEPRPTTGAPNEEPEDTTFAVNMGTPWSALRHPIITVIAKLSGRARKPVTLLRKKGWWVSQRHAEASARAGTLRTLQTVGRPAARPAGAGQDGGRRALIAPTGP